MKVAKWPCSWGMAVLAFAPSGCLRSPEARSASYMEAGKKLLREKNPESAVLQFRNAAQATPADPQTYYELGIALIELKDFRPALDAFRKVLELSPKDIGARLKIAQMMAVTNDPGLLRDAQSRLTGLLEGSSATPEILKTIAYTQLELGDTASAIQSLQQVLTQSPGELDASVSLARTKLSQNDAEGAEEVLQKASSDAPTSADARRVLGDFYLSQKRIPEAETQFRRALEIDPNWGPALLGLGRSQLIQGKKQEAEQSFKRLATFGEYKSMFGIFLFQEGRRDEALREFERLARQNPDDRDARTNLVVAYRANNRIADANEVLNKALKKNPKDADALLQRGETLLGMGNYSQAENDLNQVLRLRSNVPEVHYLLARLNRARGAVLTYRQELSTTLGLDPALQAVRIELAHSMLDNPAGARAALDLLDSAPEAQKQSTAIITERNWVLWTLGDLVNMRKGIDRGLSQERSTELLIQDGVWKLRAGQSSAARTVLEGALKIDPADVRALRALKQTYAPKEAPIALQKVKEYASQQPKSAPVQDFLGILLMGEGDRAGARVAFAAAKAADAQSSNYDLSLVQLDVLENKFADGEARLTALLSKGDSNPIIRLWLGNLEEIKGNHAAAIEHFQKAVDAQPTNSQALNNLAYLLADYANRPDDALKYATQAQELAPDNPDYADTMGWILYKKGLYPSALQQLERASSHGGNVVSSYHLAMAYFKNGDGPRGKAILDVALRKNSNVPEAKLALQMAQDAAKRRLN